MPKVPGPYTSQQAGAFDPASPSANYDPTQKNMSAAMPQLTIDQMIEMGFQDFLTYFGEAFEELFGITPDSTLLSSLEAELGNVTALQNDVSELQGDAGASLAATQTFLTAILAAVTDYTNWSTFIAAIESAYQTWVTAESGFASDEFATLQQILQSLFGIDPGTGQISLTSIESSLDLSSLEADLDTILGWFGSPSGSATTTELWTAIITGIINPLNVIETDASRVIVGVGTWLTDVFDNVFGGGNDPTSTQVKAASVGGVGGSDSIGTGAQAIIDYLYQGLTGGTDTGNSFAKLANAAASTASTAGAAKTVAQGATMVQAQQSAAKAAWNALGDITADVTFPVGPTYALASMPTISVSASTSAIGYIVTPDNVDKLSVMFVAETVGTVTGVYINVYSVGAAGLCTNVIAGSNIVGEVGTLEGVVYDDFASALAVTPGDQYAVEVVITGSGSLTIMGLGASWAPANSLVAAGAVGGSRTGTLTTVPGTFTPTASTSIPFFGLSANGGTTVPVYAPELTEYSTDGTYTYTLPSWMAVGDSVDVILLGAGAQGEAAYGGYGGAWHIATLVCGTDFPVTVTTFAVVVGAGGTVGGGYSGGATTLTYDNLSLSPVTLTAAGGSAFYTTSEGLGPSPGTQTVNGVPYYGGSNVRSYSDGSAPGGGGSSYLGGPAFTGAGADGAAWCRAYQA